MSKLDLFEATYPENLYKIPPPTTIVINTKWKDLAEKEVELLSKILNSVRLNLSSVRIVESPEFNLSQWIEKPAKLIGFGINVSGIVLYDVVSTPETQLVLADNLGVLIKDDELKKKLWISLKQLFLSQGV